MIICSVTSRRRWQLWWMTLKVDSVGGKLDVEGESREGDTGGGSGT